MVRLGLFWRFLIVMFLSSTLGLLLFIVSSSLVGERKLAWALASAPFPQMLHNALQTQLPELERSRGQPTFCAYALQSLSSDASLTSAFPSGGPNSWLEMVKASRLILQYSVGEEQVCTYPLPAHTETGWWEQKDGQRAGWKRMSLLLSEEGAPAETVTLMLQPLSGMRLLSQVAQEFPWNILFVFIAFMNFCSALTLAPLLVRRIKRAESVARSWTEGNMQARIVDHSRDEFGNLVRSFNHLADSFVDVIKVKQELAASEERNRLARDLHDTAKQRAFALNLQLTAVKSLGISNPQESGRLVGSALASVQHLQNDLSSVIKRLSATTITEMGVREVLIEELSSLFDGSGMEWDVQLSDEVNAALCANPFLAQQIFLIALEASANVLRHAAAKRVQLQLSASGENYALLISDNGKGFASLDSNSFGMGLANMRLRARSLPQGEFSIANNCWGGARVLVQFRLNHESSSELKDDADSNAG